MIANKELGTGLRQMRDWLNSRCDYPDEKTFKILDEAIAALEAEPLAEMGGWWRENRPYTLTPGNVRRFLRARKVFDSVAVRVEIWEKT